MNHPKTLPHSVDAECAMISSMMLNVEALMSCSDVPIEAFYIPAHAAVFKALLDMHEAQRVIDFRSIRQHLQDENLLEEIGGIEYLNSLWEFVPTSANCKFYLDIVTDRYHRRVTIAACQSISSSMHDTLIDATESIRDQAERSLTKLAIRAHRKEKSFKEKVLDTIDELDAQQNVVFRTGAIFGIPSLDHEIFGMLPAELWVVAAETSKGKSALAMQAALVSTMERNLYTVIFSLEMQSSELIKRMLSRQGSISMRFMRGGVFPDDVAAGMVAVAQRLGDARMQIYDDFDLDWRGVVSQCRQKQIELSRNEDKLGFIVLDYIQLIDGDGDDERKELEISNIVRRAKALSKEMKCPVLAISQLNDNKKLYGARAIKHHADGLCIIQDPSEGDDPERVDLCLAKMRNGKKDIIFNLRFRGQYMAFEDSSSKDSKNGKNHRRHSVSNDP